MPHSPKAEGFSTLHTKALIKGFVGSDCSSLSHDQIILATRLAKKHLQKGKWGLNFTCGILNSSPHWPTTNRPRHRLQPFQFRASPVCPRASCDRVKKLRLCTWLSASTQREAARIWRIGDKFQGPTDKQTLWVRIPTFVRFIHIIVIQAAAICFKHLNSSIKSKPPAVLNTHVYSVCIYIHMCVCALYLFVYVCKQNAWTCWANKYCKEVIVTMTP